MDCCNKQNHWIIYRTEYEYAREMSFSLSIDSSILLVNEAKKLVFLDFYKYEQNQKKKEKKNTYCRISRLGIIQKTDISIPKDYVSQAV